jgi:squalene-hopene/tetraprenyl-beta-curcumene cyclase
LGAIFPPIIFSLVALRALGYADASPEMLYCHRELEKLLVENQSSGALRVQPCKSPVWDTAIALRALSAGGVGTDHPSMLQAADWLLDRQVSKPGDWSETVRAAPGGWCFEFNNDFYPDSDDTAMALMALSELFRRKASPESDPRPPQLSVAAPDAEETGDAVPRIGAVVQRSAGAIERGLRWMLAMQNDDGGWGAFDRNNNRQFLCYVPFADHNAMIDPSTPDLTGRVLESLGEFGYRIGNAAVDRAAAHLRRVQEPDGSWFGRWGVNYVYGTWQALVGLRGVGVGGDDPAMVAGANWLLACQQPCGGWGESPNSYDAPSLRGQGRPTASQTAWALMGLLAAGLDAHPAVTRAVQFLVDRQQADGTWEETEFTGTGFPRVFYLRYHYYPIYFPLMALSRWAQSAAATSAEASLTSLQRTVSAPKAESECRAGGVSP